MSLQGKVALVTGAAQGLGKGFAHILLTHGAKVSLLDINETVGTELKRSFDGDFGADSTVFLHCDVTSDTQLKDAFRRTLETFGKIDIVCNNAGIIDENAWERTVSINLCAMVRGTYLALEHMKKESGAQGGVIVNVASMAGWTVPPCCARAAFVRPVRIPCVDARHISKELGRGLKRVWRRATLPVTHTFNGSHLCLLVVQQEVSKVCNYGVRVNVLCPSFTNTAILSNIDNDCTTGQFANLKDIRKKMLRDTGVLEVSEVAEGFLKLVTDESRNGSVLMVTKQGTAYATFPTAVKDLAASPSSAL